MVIIEVIFGQVTGEEIKNKKTLLNFLVLSGEYKDQTILLEGAPDVPIGTRCLMSGKFSSKKRFKVAPETSNEIEIQDDLNIISEITGIPIPEEEYRTYLQALNTNSLYTAADILTDSDARDIFLAEHPNGEQFIGLIQYVTTEHDAKSLARVFRDAGTNLGFSHALQVAYAMKNRQGYLRKNLLAIVSECPWVISQVLDGEEIDDAIKRLEKYFNISEERAKVYRAANTIINVLQEYTRRGDCFISDKSLYSRVINMGINKQIYREAFDLLFNNPTSQRVFAGINLHGPYTVEAINEAGRYLSPETKCAVYLPGIFFSEKEGAELYSILSQTPAPPLSFKELKKQVKDVEKKFGQKLNKSQMQLIESVCENKITLLTGEAGTGKSLALKVLAESYYQLTGTMPVIIAPTALAAHRAADNTSMSDTAKTIHRFASIFSDEADLIVNNNIDDRDKNVPQYSPGLVIVDECSMMGPVMLRKLLSRVTPDTRIVFAGDPNQLPPIGADGTFTAMLKLAKKGIGSHIHLSENYRNSEGVIIAARSLLSGQPLPEAENVFIHIVSDSEIPAKIVECVEKVGGIDVEDTMVLAPYRSKGYHTEAINKVLAKKYGTGALITGTEFRIGDPVIAKRNDYAIGGIPRPSTIRRLRTSREDVYNGMKGIIKDYDSVSRTVCIEFYTGLKGERLYRVEELNYYIELAYTTTVHKAQGGQARNVILVINTEGAMKNLNLIYTALTRCQEGGQVHIITKKEFLEAPYLKPVKENETGNNFEYAANRCLTKFMYRVLDLQNQPEKRKYGPGIRKHVV